MKKKIIILIGAGILAESALNSFRDAYSLWEGYNVEDVVTPEAWKKNTELVQQFYNEPRKSLIEAKPNEAHLALAKLDEKYDPLIITQNIDDLHEKVGSKVIIQLHGEIVYARSCQKCHYEFL